MPCCDCAEFAGIAQSTLYARAADALAGPGHFGDALHPPGFGSSELDQRRRKRRHMLSVMAPRNSKTTAAIAKGPLNCVPCQCRGPFLRSDVTRAIGEIARGSSIPPLGLHAHPPLSANLLLSFKSTSCWVPGTIADGKVSIFVGFQCTFAILALSGNGLPLPGRPAS
jgi:hypothetical protein